MGLTMVPVMHGSLEWDAGFGDGRKDSPRVFRSGKDDQGDLPCSMRMIARSPFFKDTCTHGIYDNMKTAVETIFVGRERAYNRRFLRMCSHYLVDPVACTPASGWEKGQVENQVGLVRERFFTLRLRVRSYYELNAWLLDQCVAYAKAHRHPELHDQTVWQIFETERPDPRHRSCPSCV